MNEIQGIARFKIHDGNLEEFKRLSSRCVDLVRTKDSGTLEYDLYFSEDQTECIVHERYRNSEALLEHFANLGDTMQAILATGSVSGEILGKPSPELMKALEGSGVRVFHPYVSMRDGEEVNR